MGGVAPLVVYTDHNLITFSKCIESQNQCLVGPWQFEIWYGHQAYLWARRGCPVACPCDVDYYIGTVFVGVGIILTLVTWFFCLWEVWILLVCYSEWEHMQLRWDEGGILFLQVFLITAGTLDCGIRICVWFSSMRFSCSQWLACPPESSSKPGGHLLPLDLVSTCPWQCYDLHILHLFEVALLEDKTFFKNTNQKKKCWL